MLAQLLSDALDTLKAVSAETGIAIADLTRQDLENHQRKSFQAPVSQTNICNTKNEAQNQNQSLGL